MVDFVIIGGTSEIANPVKNRLGALGFSAEVLAGKNVGDIRHPAGVVLAFQHPSKIPPVVKFVNNRPNLANVSVVGVMFDQQPLTRRQFVDAGCHFAVALDADDRELVNLFTKLIELRNMRRQFESLDKMRKVWTRQHESTKILNGLLRKQVYVLETLKGLTRAITSSLDFDEVRARLLKGIRETLRFDTVVLMELRTNELVFEMTQIEGDEEARTLIGTKIDIDPYSKLIRSFDRRQQVRIEAEDLNNPANRFFRKLGADKIAVAPLISKAYQMQLARQTGRDREALEKGGRTIVDELLGMREGEDGFGQDLAGLIGCILVANRAESRDIEIEDIEFLNAFAGQATITIVNSLTHTQLEEKNDIILEDLENARGIQRKIMPTEFPASLGAEFGAVYRASSGVGGDYYDVIALADGRIAALVADVSGHGVSAALTTSMVKIVVKLFAERLSPAQMLETINRCLIGQLIKGYFLSMAYCVFDPRTGALTYALAGHPAPLVLRVADGTVAELEKCGGLLIGVRDAAEYAEETIALAPGDVLLLYTDGITEAANPRNEEFETSGLARVLRAHAGAAASELARAIVDDAAVFRGSVEFEDDVTLLVMRAGLTGAFPADTP